MRYFIHLSYQGTAFHGWQKQINANTVQAEIESGLSKILRTPIEIYGSSRTDTGVHAAQQFAHFNLDKPLENSSKLVYSVNKMLPIGIAIKDIQAMPPNAHARFDATHRCYQYYILKQKNPFLNALAYTFGSDLDLEQMNKACEILKQHIDFQAFSKYNTEVKTFDCSIEYAYWTSTEDSIFFHIKANRFLRGMVRAIVGTMIEIGMGRMSLESFETIIQSKDRKNASRAAPAQGLTLMEVGYPENYF